MKKSNFLIQIFATLCLMIASAGLSAQTIYRPPTKQLEIKASETCNCSLGYSQMSDYCKEKCNATFTEIVIHGNITVGTGNPHGHENPWLMRIGNGKLPFFEVGQQGGIGVGTTLFPIEGGEFDLGTNKKPFRQISALKFAEISDRREKENIVDLPYGLKDVLQLKPVSFTWKNKAIEGTQVGLIAQEVQEVIPEIVIRQDYIIPETGEASDRLSVAYSELIPVLIHAIQEQQTIIESQKQQLNQQTSTISNMETTVSQLIEALQAQGIQTQKAKTDGKDAK
ncbi:MAG: tail fiber domain-containing protein [Chitinophagales bacterium]